MGRPSFAHPRFLPVLVLALAPAIAAGEPPSFPSAHAYEILVEFCALGPRVPGTPAHDAAFEYLRAHLEDMGAEIEVQSFEALLPHRDEPLTLRNLIGRLAPERRPRVLLGAHWDSRPWADEDPDSTRRTEPVLGANDSASGCAVLLALGKTAVTTDLAYGVDLVFFDGEDAGRPGAPRTYCLGSQEYARRLRSPPAFAIVVDMVGDRDLVLRPERYSVERAPALRRYVWERARRLGISAFVEGEPVTVFDDHVPLLEAGVMAIDIIDFDYPWWHTTGDVPERCSAASLGHVGDVLLSLLHEP